LDARNTTAGIVLSGAALLLTACGSGTPHDATAAAAPTTMTTTPTPTPAPAPATTLTPTAATPKASPPSSATGGAAACVTRDLEFAIKPSKGMGNVRSADVIITNVHANGPCGVLGYGGLGLMDAQGAALATNLVRLNIPAQGLVPQQITLAPGASALQHLEWTDTTATGGSATGCVTSSAVVLTPPDDVPSAVVPFTATVCDSGKITGWPYVAH
jgi:hypothetical protein